MDEQHCLWFFQKYRRRRLEEHPLEQQIDCFQRSRASRKILQQRKLIDYFDGIVLISTHLFIHWAESPLNPNNSHHFTDTYFSSLSGPMKINWQLLAAETAGGWLRWCPRGWGRRCMSSQWAGGRGGCPTCCSWWSPRPGSPRRSWTQLRAR